MRKPKLRELKEAIRALIKGPYTIRFPYVAHTPYERFRGKPNFNEEDCVGCTACVHVCPAKAIEFEDKIIDGKYKRKLILHLDLCIFCGQCQANCLTEKGIMLSHEFDLATTGKREDLKQEIEKELLSCECCGDVILPRDQYDWAAKRLGPLCFSNASLLTLYLRSLNLAYEESSPPKKEEDIVRSERIKILCPRCRREAVLKS